MNKFIYIFILMLLITSCHETKYPTDHIEYSSMHICENMENVREFALKCIKGAGSSGDSEPEDWLHECERMAKDMWCEKKIFKVTKRRYEKHGYLLFIKKEVINK